jgi:hypothetical protein
MAEDEFQDAPEAVRAAAALLKANGLTRARAWVVSFTALWSGLLATLLLLGVLGPLEPLALIPLMAGVAMTAAAGVWLSRSRLRTVRSHRAIVDDYRKLRDYRKLQAMALPLAAATSEPGAIDRLAERVLSLAGERPEVAEAVRGAGERARRWQAELTHLDESMAADPSLAGTLSPVRARLAEELAAIRAQLAETWAALLELDVGHADAQTTLDGAVHRLRAESEVEQAVRARPRATEG